MIADLSRVVAAVRRLHWPSPDRDWSCDCYDGLQECPTIAALDAALAADTDTIDIEEE